MGRFVFIHIRTCPSGRKNTDGIGRIPAPARTGIIEGDAVKDPKFLVKDFVLDDNEKDYLYSILSDSTWTSTSYTDYDWDYMNLWDRVKMKFHDSIAFIKSIFKKKRRD